MATGLMSWLPGRGTLPVSELPATACETGSDSSLESQSSSGPPEQVSPGQVLMSSQLQPPGTAPAARSKAVPRNTSGTTCSSRRNLDVDLAQCLRAVLAETSGVLTGGSANDLMWPFVIPNASGSAQVLARAMAKRLMGKELNPEVIVGLGVRGSIFAVQVTEALLVLGQKAVFLGLEEHGLVEGEGCRFLCPEAELRSVLGGKRIVVALPILTAQHIGGVVRVKTAVDAVQCAATYGGVATIIQYGDAGIGQVQALMSVDY